MSSPIDVLGLGCVAVDELLFVDEYPAEDTKAPFGAANDIVAV